MIRISERAQLMTQALILQRHGYRCDHGFIYFAGSRTRVRVDFDLELERATLEAIEAIRTARGAFQSFIYPLELGSSHGVSPNDPIAFLLGWKDQAAAWAPIRPILADSAAITCINTGMIKPRDILTNRNGCAMRIETSIHSAETRVPMIALITEHGLLVMRTTNYKLRITSREHGSLRTSDNRHFAE